MPEQEFRGIESRNFEALQYASAISDFKGIHELMGDADVDEMLDLAIRCLVDPHMKAETAKRLLVQFQAASMKFQTLSKYYTVVKPGNGSTEEKQRKEIYYTLADQCDKMANALKYAARTDIL